MTAHRVIGASAIWLLLFVCGSVWADGAASSRAMSPDAMLGSASSNDFGPDPSYDPTGYEVDKQLQIYGGKFRVRNPRPLLELGRPIYQGGAFSPPGTILGSENPSDPSFSLYGDVRFGIARIDNGSSLVSVLATRANIEADLKITGTERLHAFFRPFERNGQIAQCRSGVGTTNATCSSTLSVKAAALFFEGDVGAMANGWSGHSLGFDLPFAVGKMRLQLQNGLWLDDALTGVAFTVPSRHSTAFDISNMDITVFAGVNDVTTPAIPDAAGNPSSSNRLLGLAMFADANEGYWEFGMARISPRGDARALAYNNFGASFTRRYGGWLSNSIRLIHNAGQGHSDVANRRRANGTLLVLENSLVTRLPYTLVPYLNIFVTNDSPQSVARDADGGGILKNTGINFETDGLTGFPRLDDSGRNSFGGAVGVQYLFDFRRQVIVELASLRPRGDPAGGGGIGPQSAFGLRYQMALDQAWIFRSDLMVAHRSTQSGLKGVRFELRRKF